MHSKLPFRLMNFGAAMSGGHIYIGGGVRVATGAPSSAIWKLANQEWIKHDLKMPGKLECPTMFPTVAGPVIILGGYSENQEYNKSAVVVDFPANLKTTVIPMIGKGIRIPRWAM